MKILKDNFKGQAVLLMGLFVVLILVVLEAMFGFVSGASGLLPLGLDPTVQLLAIMGVLTVFASMLFLWAKKKHM